MSERTFVKHFRLTREAARELINIIEPHGDTKKISFDLAVLGTLLFMGKGSYQKNVGSALFVALSQSSVSRTLHQIVELINTHFLPLQIRFPTSDEEFTQLINGFQEKFNGAMLEVWGVIDGTLIAIVSPPIHSEEFPARVYRTRKGFTGLNVLVISDAEGKFSYVNARFPGSCHDAAIFRTSLGRLRLVAEFLERGRMRGVLLGDQGFALEPWLFSPLPGNRLVGEELAFNRSHKRVRMSVERSIGLLKTVFRCLLKDRVLHYTPTFAGSLVYAASSLHNFRINRRVLDPNDYDGDSDEEDDESEVGDSTSDEDEGPAFPNPIIDDQSRGRRTRHPGELFSQDGTLTLRRYIRNRFHLGDVSV